MTILKSIGDTNPVGRDGEFLRCWFCGSHKHLKKDCRDRQRYRNRTCKQDYDWTSWKYERKQKFIQDCKNRNDHDKDHNIKENETPGIDERSKLINELVKKRSERDEFRYRNTKTIGSVDIASCKDFILLNSEIMTLESKLDEFCDSDFSDTDRGTRTSSDKSSPSTNQTVEIPSKVCFSGELSGNNKNVNESSKEKNFNVEIAVLEKIFKDIFQEKFSVMYEELITCKRENEQLKLQLMHSDLITCKKENEDLKIRQDKLENVVETLLGRIEQECQLKSNSHQQEYRDSDKLSRKCISCLKAVCENTDENSCSCDGESQSVKMMNNTDNDDVSLNLSVNEGSDDHVGVKSIINQQGETIGQVLLEDNSDENYEKCPSVAESSNTVKQEQEQKISYRNSPEKQNEELVLNTSEMGVFAVDLPTPDGSLNNDTLNNECKNVHDHQFDENSKNSDCEICSQNETNVNYIENYEYEQNLVSEWVHKCNNDIQYECLSDCENQSVKCLNSEISSDSGISSIKSSNLKCESESDQFYDDVSETCIEPETNAVRNLEKSDRENIFDREIPVLRAHLVEKDTELFKLNNSNLDFDLLTEKLQSVESEFHKLQDCELEKDRLLLTNKNELVILKQEYKALEEKYKSDMKMYMEGFEQQEVELYELEQSSIKLKENIDLKNIENKHLLLEIERLKAELELS